MEDPFRNQKLQKSNEVKTSWFKQLKFWLFTAGVFLILVIVVFSYLWRDYKTADHLINLAPVDSILYVQARNSIWPWPTSLLGRHNYSLTDLPFENLFNQLSNDFGFKDLSFADQILPSVDQVAFLLLPSQDSLDLESVLILKLKMPFKILCLKCTEANKKVYNSLLRNSNSLEISKGIIAFSLSESALARVKAVNQGLIFSLGSQVDTKKLKSGLLRLYLDSNNLKSFFKQSQYLTDKVFTHLINHDIYLTLDNKNNQWVFNLEGGNILNQSSGGQPLVEYLPNDFNFFVSHINLGEIFKNWSETDLALLETFNQTAEGIKNIYNFNLNDFILPLLNQPIDLILFNQQESTALGLEYVLLFPEANQEQLNDFQDIIKIILAQKLPKEISRYLPDGSRVTELVADTNVWPWQNESFENIEIIYLEEPALNFEIGYTMKDNKLIIASSVNRLRNFISQQEIPIRDLSKRCIGNNSLSKYLIINNSSSFFKNYLPNGMTFIQENGNTLQGCLINR